MWEESWKRIRERQEQCAVPMLGEALVEDVDDVKGLAVEECFRR